MLTKSSIGVIFQSAEFLFVMVKDQNKKKLPQLLSWLDKKSALKDFLNPSPESDYRKR